MYGSFGILRLAIYLLLQLIFILAGLLEKVAEI